MQSGYGGVSEIQQFMVDGCGSSLFSISTVAGGTAAAPDHIHHPATQQTHKYQPPHHHHHHHQHQHPHQHQHHQPPPPQFAHFQPIPITQQLFHQSHHFQLFHHHQQGLDQESAPESSNSPTRMMVGNNNGSGAGGGGGGGRGGGGGGGVPSFLTAAMNFKLAVNESSGGGGGGGCGSREGLNDDEGILQDDDGSESRIHPWHREEESAIKEPFWRPLDIDYINRNNKRCKEKQQLDPPGKYCKKSKDGTDQHHDEQNPTTGSNYKLFSELEAIYKPGGGGGGGGGSTSVGGGGCSATNQTGSGSALTGENPLVTANTVPLDPAGEQNLNNASETSTGEEVPVKKFHKGSSTRRKRRRRQQLSSIAAFFEGLVKQLMDHQEGLHKKFLEVMERRDQERSSREEAWRKQEAAKASREAAARAQELAIASSREEAIITFLEKITGERLDLPSRADQFQSQMQQSPVNEETNVDNHQIQPFDALNYNTSSNIAMDSSSNQLQVQFNTSRWPKAEVQALIRVRSGLESRFQEPGLKGPLWEEVSATMAAMGYQRSAKRCKEKWENINKYFRKTKESGKKRPQHSKTCPYFQQLDQLYSKPLNKALPAPTPSSADTSGGANANANAGCDDQRKGGNSELLDAIVVSNDHQSFDFSDTMRYDDFDRRDEAGGKAVVNAGDVDQNNNNDEDDDEEDDDDVGDEQEGGGGGGEEGEGESQQVYAHHRHQSIEQQQHRANKGKELAHGHGHGHGDPARFFLRPES